MLAGTPNEARWVRAEQRRTLPTPLLENIVRFAFPRSRILDVQPLDGGLRNSNSKIHIDAQPEFIVLRIYEHDPSLCQKELDLFQLAKGSVPVPEIIHAEPRGTSDIPPFTLARFVEAISFHELKRSGAANSIAQAAHSAGETLAAIGRHTFSKSGWISPGPAVTAPLLEGADPLPRFVDLCLASPSLQIRMPEDLRERTHALIWSWAPQLALLENETHLVHCDYGMRNLLVNRIAEKWRVVSVLDWEFAVSGSPLIDVGHFLRYERAEHPRVEPHFSQGFLQAGGKLQQDWRQLARLYDLSALLLNLTHGQLPGAIAVEVVELIRATVENRDPKLA
jgi:aminoglycoside phosphotransferase (APT) family kinase protein